MREQEQLIALCEWAGWSKMPHNPAFWKCPTGAQPIYHETELPDTNSLDVLHEMAQTLTDAQWWQLDEWFEKNDCLPAIRATPDKFRQGLMVTLNLWREDSNEEGK